MIVGHKISNKDPRAFREMHSILWKLPGVYLRFGLLNKNIAFNFTMDKIFFLSTFLTIIILVVSDFLRLDHFSLDIFF